MSVGKAREELVVESIAFVDLDGFGDPQLCEFLPCEQHLGKDTIGKNFLTDCEKTKVPHKHDPQLSRITAAIRFAEEPKRSREFGGHEV